MTSGELGPAGGAGSARFAPVPGLERISEPDSVGRLVLRGLSEFFDPLLPAFTRDTFRAGGEVWLSHSGGSVDGLFLYVESEKLGAAFTRSRPVAESFFALHPGSSTYADFPMGVRSEVFRLYEGSAVGNDFGHRFRHPVRPGAEGDRTEVLRLLRGVHGVVDDAWLTPMARDEEACFVVEGDGELAAAAWVSVSNAVGRLHSLSVRPRYRRTGMGTDLWHARMQWAAAGGARRVVTEISEHNVGSRAIAEAGGMRWVGQIYRSGPA
jgi:GNAT superfamily N-acetyltransferase